jgi:hypothetical protein
LQPGDLHRQALNGLRDIGEHGVVGAGADLASCAD